MPPGIGPKPGIILPSTPVRKNQSASKGVGCRAVHAPHQRASKRRPHERRAATAARPGRACKRRHHAGRRAAPVWPRPPSPGRRGATACARRCLPPWRALRHARPPLLLLLRCCGIRLLLRVVRTAASANGPSAAQTHGGQTHRSAACCCCAASLRLRPRMRGRGSAAEQARTRLPRRRACDGKVTTGCFPCSACPCMPSCVEHERAQWPRRCCPHPAVAHLARGGRLVRGKLDERIALPQPRQLVHRSKAPPPPLRAVPWICR
jgi:hypothetical protein